MREVPQGVLLLYTANKSAYTIGSYSTTAREFTPDPVLNPKPVVFQPLAPLLNRPFQVDNSV